MSQERRLVATPPPCDAGQVPLADALPDPILFFATLGKFGAVLSDARTGDAIADVLSTPGRNRQLSSSCRA